MAQVWDVFDNQRSRIYEEGGLVTVKVYAVALRRDDVLRLAQHLLEAAGASPAEAVMAIGGITFPEGRPNDELGTQLTELEQLMRRAEDRRGLGHHEP